MSEVHACSIDLQVSASMETKSITMSSKMEHILMNLDEQRKDGFLCDVTLKVEGRTFRAHRNILAAASPYFKVMFGSNFKEKNQSDINLEESITADGLELILDVIYRSKLYLTTENVGVIAMAADFLEMKEVLHLCDHFIYDHVTVDTCAKYFKFARLLNMDQPATLAKRYILYYFKEVKKTDGFQNLDLRSVREILSSRDLHISGQEIEIFRAICMWLEDKSLPEKEVDRLLTDSNYIRYRSIPKKPLTKEILPHKLVNNDVRRQCIKNALTYQAELYKQPFLTLDDEKNLRGIPCFVGLAITVRYRNQNRTSKPKLVFRPITESDEVSPEINDVKLNVTLEHNSLCCISYANCFIFVYGVSSGDRNCVFLRYNVLGTWLKLEPPPLIEPVFDAMMACSSNAIYLMGGVSGEGNLSDLSLEYNIEENSWKVLPRLPAKLCSAGICVHSTSKEVFIAGGLTGSVDKFPVSDFYSFHSKTNAWYNEAEMHYRRANTSLAEAFRCLYVMSNGRLIPKLSYSPIEEYNIESSQWTILKFEYGLIGPLPKQFRCVVVEGEILIVGDDFPNVYMWKDCQLVQKWEETKRIRFKQLVFNFPVFFFFLFGTVTVPL